MTTTADTVAQLQDRWSVFLRKIDGAVDETLDDAEPALLELIMDPDGGVVPFLESVAAIKLQLFNLAGRVHTTWQDQVRPLLEEADPSEEHWDSLEMSIQGSDLSDDVGPRFERWETIVCGRGAERLHRRTLARARTSFRCTLCSADLEVTQNLYRSHYETCPYCSGKNTYEPSSELRETLYFTVDHLARYRTLPESDSLVAARERCQRARVPVPAELTDAFARAHIAYYTAFLRARIDLVPEFEGTFDKDLARYVHEVAVQRAHFEGRQVPTPDL